ncbi:hypothetical protein KDL01_38565 [Actinospica durhamensis]|uniref:Uncharacterized protein n=1 Tax=Actinospica durhamensis TaxID=1508375 RepID=A0A941EWP1_9ACTN|nr:hypothetical protein [Actinospica durhamensis]MBR7839230.1 hypothetical protein [Actinospica durhamensis]
MEWSAAQTWKPSAGIRGLGLAVSVGLEVEVCVCLVQAFTTRGGLSLAPVGVVIAGAGGLGIRYVMRTCITLTHDALIVTNLFKTHHVPLTEITDVSATAGGLNISRTDQPDLTAVAVQKSRWAMDVGSQMTRADDIASDILPAKSRLLPEASVSPGM